MGGEAKDPRDRKGRDGCVVLLGRSHRGTPEAEDTLTIISHGVQISIAGGGAEEKDERKQEASFFLFLYHIFVVKVQQIAWIATYGENKTTVRYVAGRGGFSVARPRHYTGPGEVCFA